MLDVMNELDEWIQNGEEIALATVVSTWGSAPRPIGSKMATTRSGRIAGSVSGGCVESAVFEASQEVLASGDPQLLTFGVADEDAWEVGLACGGTIQVFLEPFTAIAPIYAALKEQLNNRSPIVLVSVLQGTPEYLNRKLLFTPDGEMQGDLEITAEQDNIRHLAQHHLRQGDSVTQELGNGTTLFLETFPPSPRLVIIGAVHLAQSLVQMANAAGFETIVIDPRSAFAAPERFQNAARIIKEWPQEVLLELNLDKFDYVVVLSHDPKLDDPSLLVALNTNARYIGALGSRRTHQDRLERLKAEGQAQEQLARIHAPIGLPLGGRSTGEIAVSIMAEILLSKNNVDFHISNMSN